MQTQTKSLALAADSSMDLLPYPTPNATPAPSSPATPKIRLQSEFPQFSLTDLHFDRETRIAAAQIVSFRSNSRNNGSKSPRRNPRKANTPTRTIKIADKSDRIVKLDVYTTFRKNPRELLYSFKKRDDDFKFAARVPTVKTIENISFTSAVVIKPRKCRGQPFIPTKVDITLNGKVYRGGDPNFRIRNEQYTDTRGVGAPSWKGDLLDVSKTCEGYNKLTKEEISACRILRVFPDVYLHIKETLVSAVVVRGPYKKRDAQGWFRIDVNKTNKFYDWFKSIGWIPNTEDPPEEWSRHANFMLRKHFEMAE